MHDLAIAEIKARCSEHDRIRKMLQSLSAVCRGTDTQIDTYFDCAHGRLKLREGSIENNLIFYNRMETAGTKESEVKLYQTQPGSPLLAILTAALGVKVAVHKTREIHFIGHVKFHLDTVRELGTFIEIEAIDYDGTIGKEKLREECKHYQDLFEISQQDLIAQSYSDMLLQRKDQNR